jgi:phthiodiolone/phenolphthiodiolone dimycocerosates ketoreductase
VSLWPDSIWTPEFTDLAETSHSPHRYLDALSVASAVAARTTNTPIVTSVVDTVRRHPVLLAQTAITIGHLSGGRFVLGLGSGEKENCAPYGFDFDRAVSRFEEAVQLIRLLWAAEGPVDFDGRFYRLRHARLDAEAFGDRAPPIWIGANGPRMLELVGRHADGWWPTGSDGPEEYAAKLAVIQRAAEKAGRDPMAIVPAKMIVCLLGERDEIREMLRQPLVKAYALQLTAESLRVRGFRHPMGDHWRGIQDIEPDKLTRDRLLAFLEAVDVDAISRRFPWHAERGGPRHQGAARCRSSRRGDSRLRRHGGTQIRGAICGQGARNRGRSVAADERCSMTSDLPDWTPPRCSTTRGARPDSATTATRRSRRAWRTWSMRSAKL